MNEDNAEKKEKQEGTAPAERSKGTNKNKKSTSFCNSHPSNSCLALCLVASCFMCYRFTACMEEGEERAWHKQR